MNAILSQPLVHEKVKPKLRGVSHVFGFVAAVGGFFFLAMAPAEGLQYWAGLVYGASLMLMFGLSGLYHRPMWTLSARAVLRRFDHVGIFFLIAGTFTPVATLYAGGHWSGWLTLVWGAAVFGMLFMVAFSHAHRALRAAVYVVMGLMATPVVLRLPGLIGVSPVVLLFAGAAIYIFGATVYARRWPNPDPRVFGYHEFFHIMVIIAAALHFAAVLDLQYGFA